MFGIVLGSLVEELSAHVRSTPVELAVGGGALRVGPLPGFTVTCAVSKLLLAVGEKIIVALA